MLAARLQMLLVVRWLDLGSPDDGHVPLPLAETGRDLGLGEERRVMLDLMGALGELEDSGDISVEWAHGRAVASVTLSERLRHDVRLLSPGP